MFQIITIPSSIGAPKLHSGMEKGPEDLASYLLSQDYKNLNKEIISINVPNPEPIHEIGKYANAKYLPEVRKICENLMRTVSTIIKEGKKPLALMGDDSSVIGAVYGILKEKENVGISWFDADADLNTPRTSLSGCFYGMGLTHILGYGHPDILELNQKQKFIGSDQVVMVGQRRLEASEIELIQKKKILIYSGEDLDYGFEEKVEIITKQLKRHGVKHLFLLYDLDVVDSSEIEAVYAPSYNGLSSKRLYKITNCLQDNFEVVGVSIANYIPHKDKNNQAKSIIRGLMERILTA